MKVSVVGTGYVGLISGVCLADTGHQVACVDIDDEKVQKINRMDATIHEAGLGELLERNVGNRFCATTDLRKAVQDSELTLIAVGTPFHGDAIDLKYVSAVAHQIGEVLRDKRDYHVVVVKSTVVPGTTDNVVLPILEETSGKKAGPDFGVGMNPEFLREGEAIEDFNFPDRIVLGGIDSRTHDALGALYSAFKETDILKTSNKTAEMIKYTANSLLATMISFSNEIGNLCTALGGVDVSEVMHGVHLDKRLTPILENKRRIWPRFTTYLEAGCGFGGSCFPKDVKALIAHGKKKGQPMHLLESVIEINDGQPQKILDLLAKYVPEPQGRKIAVLGLAFKPGTDDMRESPAIPVVKKLQAKGANIIAYDPVAENEARKIFGNNHIVYKKSVSDTISGAAAVLLITRWQEFADLPKLLNAMDPVPVLIDGRRMIPKDNVRRYDGIGM